MSAYEALAGSYDELTYDIPYEKIADYFETVLRRYGAQTQSVLDLACGTGSLSILLAARGYRVLGVDCSEDMLTQASEKSMDMENAPFWICQKMQRLRLPKLVDAVVCCLDSINYLTNPKDCRETFRRVYGALSDGGVFLFDVNTPYKMKGLDGQVFLDETEDTYCVWRASFDKRRNLCRYGMDLFQLDGESWLRSAEEHDEYAYTLEELEEYLREAGFVNIRRYGDRTFRQPKDDALRVYFAAQKKE